MRHRSCRSLSVYRKGGMGHANIKAVALLQLISAERVQAFSYIAQKLAAYSEADGGWLE